MNSPDNYIVTPGPGRSPRSLGLALLVLIICAAFVATNIKNKSDIEELTMERLIIEKSIKISEVISKLLYKTQALAALVVQSDGQAVNFERSAAALIDDPAILNMLIAPNGIVSQVYPAKGNEGVLRYNLLGKGPGNKEAIQALKKGQLVFGGPFPLVQGGGQAMVGRLPVWIEGSHGAGRFWGLVSVTLKYPEALEGAGLETLEKQGFSYEIWRYNPDDGKRQVIATNRSGYNASARFIEAPVRILNAEWFFRVAPVRNWYEHPENWMLITLSIIVSLLAGAVAQSNANLRHIQGGLKELLDRDSLTGILNRRGLIKKMESLISEGTPFQVCALDITGFRKINERYGFLVGDAVLREVAARIQKVMLKRHILARIGGGDFALLSLSRPNTTNADEFWDRVGRALQTAVAVTEQGGLVVSCSKGFAAFPADGDSAEDLLTKAEKAMAFRKKEASRSLGSAD